jgi:hypothetical protein
VGDTVKARTDEWSSSPKGARETEPSCEAAVDNEVTLAV